MGTVIAFEPYLNRRAARPVLPRRKDGIRKPVVAEAQIEPPPGAPAPKMPSNGR